MSKRDRVQPRTLKGFQDHLPEDAIARNDAVARIRRVYESYGYVPFETPALEYLETLVGAGGEETSKQMFRLESPEGDPVAMRFDLTVPFARLLAQYPERLKPPVRRYHIGPVWRGDKPDPGRYREFTQCDIDVAGSTSLACDAEVIAVMAGVMRELGVDDFRIPINNRKLIDALLDDCGIHETAVQKHVLRVVDKLAKVGIDSVVAELGGGRVDDSGDPIAGVGLDASVIDKIVAFISTTGDDRAGVIAALTDRLPETKESEAALKEMADLAEALDSLSVAEAEAVFDPSLARGLDYYTGPVFEVMLPRGPQFGSVGGGGRYDGLVERFLPQPIPATGFSVGLDRLLAALRHLGAIAPRRSLTDVLVVTMRGVAPKEYLRLATEIRAAGLSCEVYFGRRKDGMGQQLSHANDKSIPVAVIMGGDELDAGQVSIKDLQEGKEAREGIEDRDAYREAGKTGQQTVARADMIAKIKAILGR